MEENTECVSDLVAYSKELEQEKLFLTSLLSKIDKEIHALQVEQLHLLNTRNQLNSNRTNCENSEIVKDVNNPSENENDFSGENGQDLDLRPVKKFDDREEFEEDEDMDNTRDENVELDNSADFEYL